MDNEHEENSPEPKAAFNNAGKLVLCKSSERATSFRKLILTTQNWGFLLLGLLSIQRLYFLETRKTFINWNESELIVIGQAVNAMLECRCKWQMGVRNIQEISTNPIINSGSSLDTNLEHHCAVSNELEDRTKGSENPGSRSFLGSWSGSGLLWGSGQRI